MKKEVFESEDFYINGYAIYLSLDGLFRSLVVRCYERVYTSNSCLKGR